eukprot:SAG11_NODE_13209_length_665_cov_1.413428_1_plen_89_part_01
MRGNAIVYSKEGQSLTLKQSRLLQDVECPKKSHAFATTCRSWGLKSLSTPIIINPLDQGGSQGPKSRALHHPPPPPPPRGRGRGAGRVL